MVRLKGKQLEPTRQLLINFNSTMVRLKEWNQIDLLICRLNFNSTMVRLKAVLNKIAEKGAE